MARLAHVNIIRLIALYQGNDPTQVGYLCELADLGSLMSYLESDRHAYSGRHVVSFARDIATGMEFLTSQSIIHRDLKSPNVLVCSNGLDIPVCKICDFG